jgi:hypothetical protein
MEISGEIIPNTLYVQGNSRPYQLDRRFLLVPGVSVEDVEKK